VGVNTDAWRTEPETVLVVEDDDEG
jgi:hypothetical protein